MADDQHLDIYEQYRNYIQHEDSLINHRMTWMLTIHGFLYASYALTLQKKVEILDRLNVASGSKAGSTAAGIEAALPGIASRFDFAFFELSVFLMVIAFVGIVVSFSALMSILAAKQAINGLARQFGNQFDVQVVSGLNAASFSRTGPTPSTIALPHIVGGGDPRAPGRGSFATWLIPCALIASWLFGIAFEIVYWTRGASYVPSTVVEQVRGLEPEQPGLGQMPY